MQGQPIIRSKKSKINFCISNPLLLEIRDLSSYQRGLDLVEGGSISQHGEPRLEFQLKEDNLLWREPMRNQKEKETSTVRPYAFSVY
jgi:hypothetical protein